MIFPSRNAPLHFAKNKKKMNMNMKKRERKKNFQFSLVLVQLFIPSFIWQREKKERKLLPPG
jgi:hypothetical protein